MKVRIALALLYGVSAASFLRSMESHFNFMVDKSEAITPYLPQNNSPFNEMPLKKKDNDLVVMEFSKAVKKDNTIEVPCVVDKMNFLVKINALEKRDKFYNYFIDSDYVCDFMIDQKVRVIVHSRQQLPFEVKLSDIERQSAAEEWYLDDYNMEAIAKGCSRALETQELVTVPYLLKNANTLEVEPLIAKIIGFESQDNFKNYFIRIKEVKK